jgi:RNA polymerase sigma-70 factor (ECF subfamily)
VSIGAEFPAVLRDAQAGSQDAIARLYRDLNPPLLRFMRVRAGDATEDLAQDTWSSVARQLAGFTGTETSFRAWFFTIAHRRLVDHWRRAARQHDAPMPIEEIESKLGAALPDDALSADAAVQALLAPLTDEQAEIVLLRVVAGLSVDDVAAIVGKRPGAVRVVQHRALRKLANHLGSDAVTP